MRLPGKFRLRINGYPGFGLLLLIWTLLGGVTYARHLLLIEPSHGQPIAETIGWLTGYYPWVLVTPLVFRLERRFPLSRLRWPFHLFCLALASLPVTFLARELTSALTVVMQRSFHSPGPAPGFGLPLLRCEFLMQQALYWCAIGGAWFIRGLIERQERERTIATLALQKSELESSLRRVELDTLRMRLNPHFLFNSLQNIATLTRQDPDTASAMLTRVGDLLRSSLRMGTQPETTLAVEVALTKAYVAIEQMRFGDRLSVLFDIEPGSEQAMVPTFLLQPLVENAITHGLRGENRSGAIWIRSMRQFDQLVLTVSDNGDGPPSERLSELEMGIGLGSTCERLACLYPDGDALSLRRLPEGGTEIRIALPLHSVAAIIEEPGREPTAVAHH